MVINLFSISDVTIDLMQDYPDALIMTWSPRPSDDAIAAAFEVICQQLEYSPSPIHVVVDIQKNPAFPLLTTINGARKAQLHPNMGNWLVIGKNGLARVIARSLKFSGKDNIEWFTDEDLAMRRLGHLCMSYELISAG